MKTGFVINNILHFSGLEALEKCKEGATIVDVREEHMIGHKCFNVEKLLFCPFSEIENQVEKLPKDHLIILADSTGLKSKEATALCMKLGMHNVANLAGGLVDWERQGLPVAINARERLSGSCMCQLKYRNLKSNGKTN